MIPKSVVDVTDADLIFSVTNPTLETVILKRNVEVASLQPISEVMDGNFSHLNESQSEQAKVPEHLKSLIEKVSDKLSSGEKVEIEDVISQFFDVFVGPDGLID